jgi:hypothetical protein
MGDQFVQVAPNSTGAKVDTSELAVGANTVERQRIVTADPTDAAGLGVVTNVEPAGGEYAPVVRPVAPSFANAWPMKIGDGTRGITLKALPAGAVGSPVLLPVWTNALQLATYTVVLDRVASGALTAGTAKAILSLEHGVGAGKSVKVRRILVSGFASTALAGTVEFTIQRGTAASTAGGALIPQPTNPATGAAELTAKSLPTIAAATVLYTSAANSVPATANSSIGSIVLYDWQEAGETQPLTLRAGALDSLVLFLRSTAAINVTLQVTVILTEE